MKKWGILVIAGVVYLLGAGVVRAENLSAPRIKERVCQMTEEKIQKRIGRYEDLDADHKVKYLQIVENLKKLADRLAAKGYNTTEIRAAYAGLNDKIISTHGDYGRFVAFLNQTKGYACGKSDGEFKAILLQAREQLRLVEQSRKEVRKYYQEVVKPALMNLKNQK